MASEIYQADSVVAISCEQNKCLSLFMITNINVARHLRRCLVVLRWTSLRQRSDAFWVERVESEEVRGPKSSHKVPKEVDQCLHALENAKVEEEKHLGRVFCLPALSNESVLSGIEFEFYATVTNEEWEWTQCEVRCWDVNELVKYMCLREMH